MLKELTWHYVIEGPHLATQQRGQIQIIKTLFEVYHEDITKKRYWLLPPGQRKLAEAAYAEAADSDVAGARIAADFIAGLAERDAVVLHQRVTGVASRSLLDIPR